MGVIGCISAVSGDNQIFLLDQGYLFTLKKSFYLGVISKKREVTRMIDTKNFPIPEYPLLVSH